MLGKTKFVGILFTLLLSAHIAKAEMPDDLDGLAAFFVVFINLPTVIAVLVLKLNNQKPGWAVIINFIIWFLYMVPFTIYFKLWAENEFKTDNLFFDSIEGLLIWLPITFVFILTVVVYLNSKNKKVEVQN